MQDHSAGDRQVAGGNRLQYGESVTEKVSFEIAKGTGVGKEI